MAFGRLERARAQGPMSEINVTPLVDVMLVLLVIFILTAPLLASSIRLDLPRADAAASAAAGTAPALALTLDAGGRLFLADRPVGETELARELALAAQRDPDTEVQLRADASVPYGRVVEVMGLAQRAGLGRIGFVTEPRPTPR